ncbi:MAG: carbamate kinase [Firmicutes bacterium]|nr:carbamate kinase [Bacillota bacterium]
MMKNSGKTIVLAFGGNAITREGQKGTFPEQLANIEVSCRDVVGLARAGYRLAITHGNGPQVGSLLIKNELAKDVVPPMPLDVCVANTQGSLGFGIQQTLQNMFTKAGVHRETAAIITRTEVDPHDEAFSRPTKPVGPFFSQEEARELMAEKGYAMREDSGRGWRRVVPSPRPLAILEKQVIKRLVEDAVIVVAVGGGGIPVVSGPEGYSGVEAVIDKDLAAQRLALDIGADMLAILTGVPVVYLDFRKPAQRALERLTASAARKLLGAGQFPPGSMGPKIEAAAGFVEQSGGTAVITDFATLHAALDGRGGTMIVSG